MIRRPPRSPPFPTPTPFRSATGATLGHLLSHTLVSRDMATILINRGQINAARTVIDNARTAEASLPHLLNIPEADLDRKSTRLNSSHANISYAVFCLKKNKN